MFENWEIFNHPEEIAKQVADWPYLWNLDDWSIRIDVYRHKKVIFSQEFTNEVIEAALSCWIKAAKKTLDDEITYSYPTSEYKMVICKKDFN